MSQARAVPVGHAEPHGGGMATRLNWVRAAVLGANDGIVSTAGLVVGVAELARIYESKGLQPGLARHVAEELTAHDSLAAHAEAELGIDPEQLAHPGHAAWASFLSFTAALSVKLA